MNSNISTFWATCICDELARCGLREAVIAPGSRSTPLALALEAHPDIRGHVVQDERGAGFEALGMAATLSSPVAVLCTSGTAAANLYPAVCEAMASHVPLLVLTADRPLHEQAAGTPQTMDQTRLFGAMTVDHVALPTPSPEESILRALRARMCHAFWKSTASSAGPVHINIPFRKPLEPGSSVNDRFDASDANRKDMHCAIQGRVGGAPWTRHFSGTDALSRGTDLLRSMLEASKRPVIIAGPHSRACRGLLDFAQAWNIPVFAEALSQLRGCGHPLILEHSDVLFRNPEQMQRFSPDLILRLGGTATAATMLRFLDTSLAHHVVITPWEERCDPDHQTELYLHADPESLGETIGVPSRKPFWNEWTLTVREADDQMAGALKRAIHGTEFFEGVVVNLLAEELPSGSTIVVSSSMPVRDLETFFHPAQKDIEIVFNRGVNGIDGLVSTALGVAALRRGPVYLLLGDVALLHDLNALARLSNTTLRIVVLNNNGGQIFASLPIRDYDPAFTRLFLTPHGVSFSSVAEALGIRAVEVGDRESVSIALQSMRDAEGPQLMEVRTALLPAQAQRERLLDSIVCQTELSGEDREISDQPVLFSRRFRAGDGKPLLLLHGFSKDHRSWRRVVEELHTPGSVIAADLPGHGFSPPPRLQNADEIIEWFHRELDRWTDEMGPIDLAGYSMGGRLALSYASARPGRIRRLALISANGGIKDHEDRVLRAERDANLATTVRSAGLHAFLSQWESLPLLLPHRQVPPAALREQSFLRHAQSVEGLAWALHHLSPGRLPCLDNALRTLECPLLLVTGEADVQYSETAQVLAASSRSVSLEIIPNAGHDLLLEAPEELARILTSWFSS